MFDIGVYGLNTVYRNRIMSFFSVAHRCEDRFDWKASSIGYLRHERNDGVDEGGGELLVLRERFALHPLVVVPCLRVTGKGSAVLLIGRQGT